MTLHPDPIKKGVNISKVKYYLMKSAIIKSIESAGEITY